MSFVFLGLTHFIEHNGPLGPSVLLNTLRLHSFQWPRPAAWCVCATSSGHSSADGPWAASLSCLLHATLWSTSGCTCSFGSVRGFLWGSPRSGRPGHRRLPFNGLRKPHTGLHSGRAVCSPSTAHAFPFPHSLARASLVLLWMAAILTGVRSFVYQT